MAEPSIVLLEPQHPGNIGSACRAMKNFGFKDLILVNPCQLTGEATIMAVHAADILKNARIVSSLEDTGCDYLVATTAIDTANDDTFHRMSATPETLKTELSEVSGKIGFVFGREDRGLSNEEIKQCDRVVTIPTAETYPEMNISHAVAVFLYALSDLKLKATPRLANPQEKTLLYSLFDEVVGKTSYPVAKRKVFNTMIAKVLGRARVTGREANTLIGVLKKIRRRI